MDTKGKYDKYLSNVSSVFSLLDGLPHKYKDFAADIVNYSMIASTKGALRGQKVDECAAAVGTNDLSFEEMEDLLDGTHKFHDRVRSSMASWYSLVWDVVAREKEPAAAIVDILDKLEKSVYPGMNNYLDVEMTGTVIGIINEYKEKISSYRLLTFN